MGRKDGEGESGFLRVIRPSSSYPVGFFVYHWANSVTILPTPPLSATVFYHWPWNGKWSGAANQGNRVRCVGLIAPSVPSGRVLSSQTRLSRLSTGHVSRQGSQSRGGCFWLLEPRRRP